MGNIVASNELKWGFPYFAPNGNTPSPFLYQVALDHEIPPGMLFHDCLVSIAEAHRDHPQGNVYACYGTWIGRGIVWLLYPLQSEEKVKNLINDEKSLCIKLGDEAGKKRYAEYRSTLISDEAQTLQYQPQYSNPQSSPEDYPMEYIFYITFELANSSKNTKDFDQAVKKIIEAHQKHENGIHWMTYKNMQTNELHLFAPMRYFGEMDNWPRLKEVLKIYGQKDAQKIRDTFYKNITNKKIQIMTFVPSCDNSGCQFIEN